MADDVQPGSNNRQDAEFVFESHTHFIKGFNRMSASHRVLVLGVGSIGERHLRCFQNTGRAELSFVEINPQLRTIVAERYSIQQHFGSLDEALAASQPSCAVVATPAPFHIPMSQQLADRGVHLLIEKPLSTSFDGIDKLQQTVHERKLVTGVGYTMRMHPSLIAMQQAVASGRFGKPVQLVAVTGQHFPTYRPAYRTIYYNNHATGGGAIQDALTHLLNAGEWMLGPINRLVVDAAHQVLPDVSVEDTVNLLARHGDVLASYSLNQHQPANEFTLTVICDGGMARFEGHERRWRWTLKPDSGWQDEVIPAFERDVLYIAQANAFLDALEGQPNRLCSLTDALQTLKVNLAALASCRSGKWEAT